LVLQNSVETFRATTDSTGTVTGTYIPGDSMYVEAYAFAGTFPPPATGTSTITLIVVNTTDGTTLKSDTISYTAGTPPSPTSISYGFTITRAKNYSITAYTTYTPVSATPTPSVTPSRTPSITPTKTVTPSRTPSITPTPSPQDPATATLFFSYANDTFTCSLSSVIYTASTTISYAAITGYGDFDCTTPNANDTATENIVINAGTSSDSAPGSGFFNDPYYQFDNGVTVNGNFLQDNDTITIGNTLVTISLPFGCNTTI
jgi:hypothetical protein